MRFFGDGVPETLDYLLQNLAKHFCFEPSTLKIGYGALQLTTQAPKTLFYATKWHFLAIFGQKMRFFLVMAAPKHSKNCSKNLQNTFS